MKGSKTRGLFRWNCPYDRVTNGYGVDDGLPVFLEFVSQTDSLICLGPPLGPLFVTIHQEKKKNYISF